MYKVENFTRPYLPDVSSFTNLILGDVILSEENLENYICNDAFFCKIILDQLKETLGYMACEIKENIGYIHTASILESMKGENLEVILIENCLEELYKRGVSVIYTIIKNGDDEIINLFEKQGFIMEDNQESTYLLIKK